MPAFKTVDQLITGPGCFAQLGELARPLGRRALLVTGRHAMRNAGVTARACLLLEAAGLETRLFAEIAAEPTAAEVDAARLLCREERCDLVIGLGGGSPIDAAKAAAALVNAPAPTAEYVAGRPADADSTFPCIAVPTTSGTGAEVTPNAVISVPGTALRADSADSALRTRALRSATQSRGGSAEQRAASAATPGCAPQNTSAGIKNSIRGRGILPAVALVDPDLTLTCPPAVTAASGMDALTQAVESCVSILATPITDALSFHAAELLLAHLPAAYRDGTNRAARAACSYGSVMAGIALAHARLGVVHGIAHPLAIRYHIPHGLCCAVLLAPSIRLNRAFASEKYARLDHAAGRDLADAVDAMLDEFSIPHTFAAYRIAAADFPAIASESMPSGSIKANPKTITEQDVIRLLEQVAE